MPKSSVPTAVPDMAVVSKVPQVAEFHQEKIILKRDMVRLADSGGL